MPRPWTLQIRVPGTGRLWAAARLTRQARSRLPSSSLLWARRGRTARRLLVPRPSTRGTIGPSEAAAWGLAAMAAGATGPSEIGNVKRPRPIC